MFFNVGNAIACSCGLFVVPTPCELIVDVNISTERDFVAIVDLVFVEQLDYSRSFRIDQIESLAGVTIPAGTLLESFEGSLCGQNLARTNHKGLLVGVVNSEGRVVPSICHPEDSFFPIVNGEVVVRERNGKPEARYPLGGISNNDCFFFEGIEAPYYIDGSNLVSKTINIRSGYPQSNPIKFSIVNSIGLAIATDLPLGPLDTSSFPSGRYFAIVRTENGDEYVLPFVVAQ